MRDEIVFRGLETGCRHAASTGVCSGACQPGFSVPKYGTLDFTVLTRSFLQRILIRESTADRPVCCPARRCQDGDQASDGETGMNDYKSSRKSGAAAKMAQTPDVRFVMRAPQDVQAKAAQHDNGELIAPIERGLAILNAFLADDTWLGNQEIAVRTSIPKATVTRLTQTLAAAGCLRHSPSLRKYRLAPTVLALGYAAIANSDVVTTARPLMQQLADENSVFVSMAGRDGLDMVLLENCHSASTLLTLGLRVGAHVPIAATPLGLALLSGLPQDERRYLLDHILKRYNKSYRVMLRERVDDAVQQVADKGYVISIGDWGPDIAMAAAPLYIPNKPLMAIGCAGPTKRVTKAKLVGQIGPRLVELVNVLRTESRHYYD
jgi:DNA-binding IclR family transcriptional regulator